MSLDAIQRRLEKAGQVIDKKDDDSHVAAARSCIVIYDHITGQPLSEIGPADVIRIWLPKKDVL